MGRVCAVLQSIKLAHFPLDCAPRIGVAVGLGSSVVVETWWAREIGVCDTVLMWSVFVGSRRISCLCRAIDPFLIRIYRATVGPSYATKDLLRNSAPCW